MKLLLIEDDDSVAAYILKGLREQGHVLDHAPDGREGLFLASTEHYEMMIIDRMLPHMDGLALLRTIRAAGNQTPVLILSALGEVDDRVTGLQAGGDDYLTKPFAFAELTARLEALARRAAPVTGGGGAQGGSETVLQVGCLEMDLSARWVRRAGQPIDLQPREFRLLEYLMRHVDQVVTRTMLLERVWDYSFDPQTNVVDVHISRLRRKVDAGFEQSFLETVRGAGYVIRSAALSVPSPAAATTQGRPA